MALIGVLTAIQFIRQHEGKQQHIVRQERHSTNVSRKADRLRHDVAAAWVISACSNSPPQHATVGSASTEWLARFCSCSSHGPLVSGQLDASSNLNAAANAGQGDLSHPAQHVRKRLHLTTARARRDESNRRRDENDSSDVMEPHSIFVYSVCCAARTTKLLIAMGLVDATFLRLFYSRNTTTQTLLPISKSGTRHHSTWRGSLRTPRAFKAWAQ
ncbi:hypothetical protein SVAN01_06721 [Stagonosporopsis vannaccii]|nr:hypothetical protein SVAN01_06721 [Stagonosporopsis vannaccii]